MKKCQGTGKTIYADLLEKYMLKAIKIKLAQFSKLTAQEEERPNPKLNEDKLKLVHIETEIEKLLTQVTNANEVLLRYINEKIESLDAERKRLKDEILKLSTSANGNNLNVIRNHVEQWEEISFTDKQAVVDTLIKIIYIADNKIDITWNL